MIEQCEICLFNLTDERCDHCGHNVCAVHALIVHGNFVCAFCVSSAWDDIRGVTGPTTVRTKRYCCGGFLRICRTGYVDWHYDGYYFQDVHGRPMRDRIRVCPWCGQSVERRFDQDFDEETYICRQCFKSVVRRAQGQNAFENRKCNVCHGWNP